MTLYTTLKREHCYPGPFTRKLHGFILEMIRFSNQDLSKQLHDSKEKTMYAIFIENREQINICSINKEIIVHLQRSFLENPVIETDIGNYKIHEIHVKNRSLSDAQHALEDIEIIHIRFQTPTAFTQSGHYYILPEPKRIFSSALITYNRLEEVNQPLAWEDLLPIIEKLVMIDLKIKSKPTSFGLFTVNGFVGYIRWNMKRLTLTEKRILCKLLVCMEVMGVGTKTAWGMGKIIFDHRMLRKNPRGSSKPSSH